MFFFFQSSLSLFVTIIAKNRRECYEVFKPNDLALFYSVYLCFIFDLRRDSNKHNCILNYGSSFLLGNFNLRLYHTTFKLNIVSVSRVVPLGPHWTQCGTHSAPKPLLVFPNLCKTQNFFTSWVTPWSHLQLCSLLDQGVTSNRFFFEGIIDQTNAMSFWVFDSSMECLKKEKSCCFVSKTEPLEFNPYQN